MLKVIKEFFADLLGISSRCAVLPLFLSFCLAQLCKVRGKVIFLNLPGVSSEHQYEIEGGKGRIKIVNALRRLFY